MVLSKKQYTDILNLYYMCIIILILSFEYAENVSITSLQGNQYAYLSFSEEIASIEDGRWINRRLKSAKTHVVVTKVKTLIAETPQMLVYKLVNSITKYKYYQFFSIADIWLNFAS